MSVRKVLNATAFVATFDELEQLLEAKDDEGMTAMHVAALKGHAEAVVALATDQVSSCRCSYRCSYRYSCSYHYSYSFSYRYSYSDATSVPTSRAPTASW